jgi:hypothetical protein
MTKVKKEIELLSGTSTESENDGLSNSDVKSEAESVHAIRNVARKGNYSGIGYNKLKSPLSEAEHWNMPFMDPEFEYESNDA